MTRIQAENTVSAATSVGYSCRTVVDAADNWFVFILPGITSLDLQLIAQFAAANTLTGTLETVKLS